MKGNAFSSGWKSSETIKNQRCETLIYRIIILSLLVVTLSGCETFNVKVASGECTNKTLPALLDATDLKALFQDIAAELCTDNCFDRSTKKLDGKVSSQACSGTDDPRVTTVLVTDFADIQTFLPNQSGLLMGELMRGSLNNVCCYKITQAEFGKYFMLSENGLVVLTRKISEIKKDEYSQPEMIVGTYSYANNSKVVIFVRRINTETGRISKMVTREINYSCSGRSIVGFSVK